GHVFTFNDEVSCRAPVPLPKTLTGAVLADKCLDILRKMPEEELEVKLRKGDLTFGGKRRWAGLRLEAEVVLAVDAIQLPEKWRKLPEEFGEAAGTVARCASRDQSRFAATCVHLHPEFVESSDDTQVCRWPLALGLKEPVLVRHTSLQHVATLGATGWGLTKDWLHFRAGKNGLVMSCRRYADEYPDLGDALKVRKGAAAVQFPKGVAEECERSDVFSSENPDQNLVRVEMSTGKLRVRADGVSGWFMASRKLAYDGPPLAFYCPPQLLIDLVKRAHECLVAEDRLWVKSPNYTWMSCLSRPEESEQPAETAEEESNDPE
ncbi:MAG: hypothetical protein AAB875_05420, partial [Patescibacteria group bacterium]